jgi:DNA-binding MarR family transcriptional regulator
MGEMTKMNAITVLNELHHALGVDAPLSYARVFCSIAASGEEDQGSLQRRLGISPSAMVRAVQAMGASSWVKDANDNRKEGLGLIRSEIDPKNFRLRRLTLTAEGRELARRVGL